MNPWPKHPVIYEINTWVWLQELSQEYKSPVTLAKIPREKWDGIADLKESRAILPARPRIFQSKKGKLEQKDLVKELSPTPCLPSDF